MPALDRHLPPPNAKDTGEAGDQCLVGRSVDRWRLDADLQGVSMHPDDLRPRGAGLNVDRETQLRRLMGRDGMSREEAEQRLAAQMSMEEKARRGRLVIDNRGSLEALERTVREIWARESGGQGNET